MFSVDTVQSDTWVPSTSILYHEDAGSMSLPKHWYPPIRTESIITQKTIPWVSTTVIPWSLACPTQFSSCSHYPTFEHIIQTHTTSYYNKYQFQPPLQLLYDNILYGNVSSFLVLVPVLHAEVKPQIHQSPKRYKKFVSYLTLNTLHLPYKTNHYKLFKEITVYCYDNTLCGQNAKFLNLWTKCQVS
jgi:hypothetical protein